MALAQWTEIDDYITDVVVGRDPATDAALKANVEAGLPAIDITANEGRLLELLVSTVGARSILEVGTLGGFSTIWLARALPDDGQLVTLEVDPHYAEVAASNIAAAGLSDRVELRVGPALETLPELANEGRGPFDFIFIDADKQNNPGYFEWALKLSHPGTLIVVDNVVRDGRVIDPGSEDPSIQGVRKLFEMIAAEPRVRATAIQTVGAKGHDGFALIFVDR